MNTTQTNTAETPKLESLKKSDLIELIEKERREQNDALEAAQRAVEEAGKTAESEPAADYAITIAKGIGVSATALDSGLNAARAIAGNAKASARKAGREDLLSEIREATGESYRLLTARSISGLQKAEFLTKENAAKLRAAEKVISGIEGLLSK